MYRVDAFGIDTHDSPAIDSVIQPSALNFPWKIRIINRSGGTNVEWTYGIEGCPVSRVVFNRSLSGPLDCKITVVRVDFPVKFQDEVIIDFLNKRKYRGYVESYPDEKGGVIGAISYSKRLKQARYAATLTNKTKKEIVELALVAKQSQTGIFYNDTLTKIDDTEQKDYIFEYPHLEKILMDIKDETGSRVFGVNEYGFAYFKPPQTAITHIIYNNDAPPFRSIAPARTSRNIKYTRLQVFQKVSGNAELTRIGQVGYGGSYPTFVLLEDEVGIIEDKITAPEDFTSVQALAWAYAKITDQSIPQGWLVKGLDLRKFNLNPNDRIQTWDEERVQLVTLIDCETISGWNGGILSSLHYEGLSSVQFNTADMPAVYDFGKIRHISSNAVEFVSMMLYADMVGNYLEYSYGTNIEGFGSGEWGAGAFGESEPLASGDLWNENYDIVLSNLLAWQYIRSDVTPTDIRYFSIRLKNSAVNAIINIDSVKSMMLWQKMIIENVAKIKYDINPGNIFHCDVKLSQTGEKANKALFRTQADTDSLQEIQVV